MTAPPHIAINGVSRMVQGELFSRFRRDIPVCVMHSPPPAGRGGRLIIASPRAWHIVNADGTHTARGEAPFNLHVDNTPSDPLEIVNALVTASRPHLPTGPPEGAWMVMLSYDLGRLIEPVAQHHDRHRSALNDRDWPLLALAWCPDRLIVDSETAQWQPVGDRSRSEHWFDESTAGNDDTSRFSVGPLTSSFTEDDYRHAVERIIDFIGAGDIFQANLTQRFSATFDGSTRELARRAFDHSRPRYGAYLEMPDGRCIVSMSPELFLDVDPLTRDVITRPIKGTRSASQPDAARELRDSIKDQAELTMIVDLMRNDLGRVCRFGTVHVTEPRTIETHPTVHHGVSTIQGTLREGITLADLLRATFPGGSITGTPKIRAMQIIDEIEPVRRGPYCGSIGWMAPVPAPESSELTSLQSHADQHPPALSDQHPGRQMPMPSGDCRSPMGGFAARLNIAIRTILLSGRRDPGRADALIGTLDYGAGGGIVADSNPHAEYRESIDKAAVLRLALDHAAQVDTAVHADQLSPSDEAVCTECRALSSKFAR
jgi:para-aminobenzoate synthetase component I